MNCVDQRDHVIDGRLWQDAVSQIVGKTLYYVDVGKTLYFIEEGAIWLISLDTTEPQRPKLPA